MVIVTYDEFGGQWDHVSPPGQGDNNGPHDVWGPGTRIPALIIARALSIAGRSAARIAGAVAGTACGRAVCAANVTANKTLTDQLAMRSFLFMRRLPLFCSSPC